MVVVVVGGGTVMIYPIGLCPSKNKYHSQKTIACAHTIIRQLQFLNRAPVEWYRYHSGKSSDQYSITVTISAATFYQTSSEQKPDDLQPAETGSERCSRPETVRAMQNHHPVAECQG